MSTGFIAETDTKGQVMWVWRKAPDDRVARPISDPSSVVHELAAARCSGASVEAISDWFARQTKSKR